MADVPDHAVLLLKPVIHLLSDITFILSKLIQSVLLDPLNLGALPVQLRFKFLNEFSLHLLALILLLQNSILDLFSISRQIIKDCPLISHSLVTFLVKVPIVNIDLLVDRCQLVIQVLDSVCTLLSTHIIKSFYPVVASLDLICLVFGFFFKCVVEVLMQALQLLFEFGLVSFQRLIHLLAFIDCILLDVFDFSTQDKSGLQSGAYWWTSLNLSSNLRFSSFLMRIISSKSSSTWTIWLSRPLIFSLSPLVAAYIFAKFLISNQLKAAESDSDLGTGCVDFVTFFR